MPNWCNNSMLVEGSPEDLAFFKQTMNVADKWGTVKVLSEEPLIPCPEEMRAEGADTTKWERENYGTKWGFTHPEIVGETENSISYVFDSAWGPLDGLFRVMGEKFPNLHFTIDYEELGMDFAGSYYMEGGDISHEDKPVAEKCLECGESIDIEQGQLCGCERCPDCLQLVDAPSSYEQCNCDAKIERDEKTKKWEQRWKKHSSMSATPNLDYKTLAKAKLKKRADRTHVVDVDYKGRLFQIEYYDEGGHNLFQFSVNEVDPETKEQIAEIYFESDAEIINELFEDGFMDWRNPSSFIQYLDQIGRLKNPEQEKTERWEQRWKKRSQLKIATTESEEKPKDIEYEEVNKLLSEGNYTDAIYLVLQNPRIKPMFDVKELASKANRAELFDFINRNNIDAMTLLTEKDVNSVIDDIKFIGKVFGNEHRDMENFFEWDIYKSVESAAKSLDFDLLGYLKQEYPAKFYEYPALSHNKTLEEVKKLRDTKVTDTDHREFPYKVTPMKKTPAGVRSEGKFKFSFAINSTDNIFPREIFETLNKHYAEGEKPVAFVFGSYTPNEVLYVDEMQSDIIQRAQMYLQSPEQARAKFQSRIDELTKQYEGKEMPDEIRERVQKDMKNLERINAWKSDFMPEYGNYRSKIQNYFSGWNIICMNTVLNFAQENNIPNVFVASADMLEKKWLGSGYGAGEFTKDLYARMYDDMVQSKYSAVREGDWWEIDVKGVSNKIALKKYTLKKQAIYEEDWQVYTYDVWGNNDDGYEVNNIYPGKIVQLPPKANLEQIIEILKDAGYLNDHASIEDVYEETSSSEDTIYLSEIAGAPILELQRVSLSNEEQGKVEKWEQRWRKRSKAIEHITVEAEGLML